MMGEDVSATLPTIDVVIVNWNSGPHLRRCVAALQRVEELGAQRGHVVIVDNASRDGSCGLGPSPGLRVEVVTNSRNVGFAAACNQGAARGRAARLLFLNPDVELEPESLSGLSRRLLDDAGSPVGVIGIQLLGVEGRVQRSCARFPSAARMLGHAMGLDRFFPWLVYPHMMTEWGHDDTRFVDQVIGAFMLMRRSDFERLGGFDERFFLYMDDVDFAFRARQIGLKSLYIHDRRARHAGGGTTERIRDVRLAYLMRSRVLYARKHFGSIAAAIVTVATLIIEPGIRMLYAVGRGQFGEAKACRTAFRLCWRRFPFRRNDQTGEIGT